MPLQFLEIGFHVEIHAIEWHDFQHETQFHGSCSGMNRIFSIILCCVLRMFPCRLLLLLVGAISSVGPLGLDVVGLIAHLRITSGKYVQCLMYFHVLYINLGVQHL